MKRLYEFAKRKAFPGLEFYLNKWTNSFDSLADFGCGPASPAMYLHIKKKLGIDAANAAIDESRKRNIFTEYLVADVLHTGLRKKSYDVTMSLDVVNLMEKKDGLALIKEMERIAKKRVIILCPNGSIEEPKEMKGQSHSKYKSEYKYLKYRSSWTAKGMRGKGYTVIGINGLKWLRESNAKPRIKPTFLGVIISDASQLFARFFPSTAFHLLCYKELKQSK